MGIPSLARREAMCHAISIIVRSFHDIVEGSVFFASPPVEFIEQAAQGPVSRGELPYCLFNIRDQWSEFLRRIFRSHVVNYFGETSPDNCGPLEALAGLAAACSSGVANAYKACRRQSHRASF